MAQLVPALEDADDPTTSTTYSFHNNDNATHAAHNHYHAAASNKASKNSSNTNWVSDLIRDNLERLYNGEDTIQIKILSKILTRLSAESLSQRNEAASSDSPAPIQLQFQKMETSQTKTKAAASQAALLTLALPHEYAWEWLVTAADFKLRAGQEPIVNLSDTACNSPLTLLGVLDYILGIIQLILFS